MLLSNIKIRHVLKTIFINHHVMCSPISSYSNHLNNILMNVNLIMMQLELMNGIVTQSLHQTHDKH
jgi:hypothetical protein